MRGFRSPSGIGLFRATFLRAGTILSIAGCTLGVAACAGAQDLAPAQQQLVARVCEKTMKLLPNTSEFETCTDSLGQSLAEATANDREAAAIADGRRECGDKGLMPDTTDYALCILDHRDRALGRPQTAGVN
jgi:hypothetical protein